MKLSEMPTDKMFDVLSEITPELGSIAEDKEFIDIFKAPSNKNDSQIAVGLKRIASLLPFLLKKHRNAIYKITATISEKTIDEISKQKGTQTIKEIKELLQDKELITFFQ